MTITAKFSSTCPTCRTTIEAGSQVEWTPGSKATHKVCPVSAQPVAPVARITIEDAGVYVMPNGDVVKVQANQEKTRTYAKRWVVISGERLTEADTRVHGEYQFEAGLVAQVAQVGRKMTLEEAKAFILRYGQCARCSRKLVAAKSVEQGIGPVCIKYFSAGTTGADLMVSPSNTTTVSVEANRPARPTIDGPAYDDDPADRRYAREQARMRAILIEEEEYAF